MMFFSFRTLKGALHFKCIVIIVLIITLHHVFTGNGGLNLLLLSSKNEEDDSGLDQSCARFDDDVSVNGVIKPTPSGLCFLDAAVEWNAVRLNGEF